MDKQNDSQSKLSFRQISVDLVLVILTKKDFSLEQKWMTLEQLEKEFHNKVKC